MPQTNFLSGIRTVIENPEVYVTFEIHLFLFLSIQCSMSYFFQQRYAGSEKNCKNSANFERGCSSKLNRKQIHFYMQINKNAAPGL